MKRRLCLFIFLACCLGAWAQEASLAGFGIETNIVYGRVLKHTPNFRPPIPDRSMAYEVNLLCQTDGRRDWQQRRNYPVIGFGLTLTDYGMEEVYGKCIAAFPNLQIPIVRYNNLEWTLRAGFGLGYVTRRFDRANGTDTLNNAIGSHFNNYSCFSTDLRYRLNHHIDLQTGLNFSHISNASLRTPNLGINMYGAHIGLRYFPEGSEPKRIKKTLPALSNRWLRHLRIGVAGTEYGSGNGPIYPVYLFSAFISRRYLSQNKLFAGIDYSYHEGIYAFLRNNEIHAGEEKAQSSKASVFAGSEFLFGRVGLLLQIGYYFKDSYLRIDPYYQKLGMNFYLWQAESGFIKEISAGILLKTHRLQAELAEAGLGIGF